MQGLKTTFNIQPRAFVLGSNLDIEGKCAFVYEGSSIARKEELLH